MHKFDRPSWIIWKLFLCLLSFITIVVVVVVVLYFFWLDASGNLNWCWTIWFIKRVNSNDDISSMFLPLKLLNFFDWWSFWVFLVVQFFGKTFRIIFLFFFPPKRKWKPKWYLRKNTLWNAVFHSHSSLLGFIAHPFYSWEFSTWNEKRRKK